MQQKNLIAFMIASALILFGWMWLQQVLFPVKPKDDKSAAIDKKDKEAAKKAAVAEAKKWSRFAEAEKHALVVAQAIAFPSLIPLAAREHPEQFLAKVEAAPAAKEKEPETFTLGGKDFFLTVKLTTHGAGIEQVTLNKFKGADRLGLPTGDDLHLIPEDPFMPSFLLYHYNSKDDERPVPTLGRRTWTCEDKPVIDDNGAQIRFSTQAPDPFSHLTLTKIYTLGKRDYHIGLILEIQDTRPPKEGEVGPAFRYQLTGAHGMPIEGEWYSPTYRNAVIGMVKSGSLFRDRDQDARKISFQKGGDKVPQGQRGGEEFIQYAGVCTQYFASMLVVDDKQAPADEDGVDKKSILAWARPTLEATEMKGHFVRLAADKKSFIVRSQKEDLDFRTLPRVLDGLKNLKESEPVVVRFYEGEHKVRIASHVRAGAELHSFTDDVTVRAVSEPVELERGKKAVHKFLLYHGPIKVKLLAQMGADSPSDELVERYADTLHLRRLTDYGNFAWWTDLIIACTNLMHWLLYLLHSVLSILPNYLSYGLSIILLTVVVRGMMFPISRKQAKLSMRMQELAPELKKVQEKYKTDPKGKNEAVMALYRQHNVHPLGGCLPLLLQMPVFMGLYYALQESVHFRLQPFLWIKSLAAPDMAVWWGQAIPIISDPDNHQSGSLFSMFYLGPYLNLLPIIAVVFMQIQQKMLTPPPTDEQQEMNQKVMKYMMIVFGIMFYKVAAGLCIYFIASSLWGLAERKLLPKKKRVAGIPTTADGKPTPALSPRKARAAAKKEAKKPDGAVQKVKDWWADLLEQARKK